MPKLAIFLACLLVSPAYADVWRWVDASGQTHYVDSNQAIYTWTDDSGKAHYSDKPDHEDAIRVQLFWHSKGTLAERQPDRPADAGADTAAGETVDQRESVVAHNCKRANEILAAYENAPKLYRTDDNGKRNILTDAEYEAELEDARVKTRQLCSQ